MRSLFLSITLSIVCSISFSQSLFKLTETVDEFGDVVGKAYRNVAVGTFSNTATTGSELIVNTIYTAIDSKPLTLAEYQQEMKDVMIRKGYSAKEIEETLPKFGRNLLEEHNSRSTNLKGSLQFKIFEYGDNPADFIGAESGAISIKLSNGEKLRASLSQFSIEGNTITVLAYNKITTGAGGLKGQIDIGLYDWKLTEIFNAIESAEDAVQVVIGIGRSQYNFTLKP